MAIADDPEPEGAPARAAGDGAERVGGASCSRWPAPAG